MATRLAKRRKEPAAKLTSRSRIRTSSVVFGAGLIGISKVMTFRALQGVAGTLSALGYEAASDKAQTDTFFAGVARNLWIWTLPGLIGLAILGWALIARDKLVAWVALLLLGGIMLASPFYSLHKYRMFLDQQLETLRN